MKSFTINDGTVLTAERIKGKLIPESVYVYNICDLLDGPQKMIHCILTIVEDKVKATCSAPECPHLFPAIGAGVGAEVIDDLLADTSRESFDAVVPLFFRSGDLITKSVKLKALDTPAGRFLEVVMESGSLHGIAPNTVLYNAGGKSYHSIGLIGYGENYDTIKTMISTWCLYAGSDLVYSRGSSESPFDECKSHRHNPRFMHTVSHTDDQGRITYSKQDLALLVLTGYCPACFNIEQSIASDVPIPF